ncbi:acyl esterase [Bermanella marisrubri]|uniref:alpha/beta fold hydrolase n=1 Tax=Bermanella marisrubri TaxID=207949 RepID=UPI000318BE43|nr:alpha/beta fold hydrolase [Bermanella marisrubri]QIZ82837.1 acyl esterase [Bermanella marisrubri]
MKKLLLTWGLSVCLLLPTHFTHADGLLPIISFAAGLLNQGVFPKSDAYTTDDDIEIIADDGVNLSANIFVPNDINGQAPAIIFINSWGLNEYEYLKQAGELAEKGYIVLSYSTRGWGTSGGQINTAGPKDMADLSNVIDFLIANYPVDPNNIGSAGISYGSGISLLGAAHDDRIKAVSAMSSWGDLVDALYGNNTPRLVWGEILTLTGDLLGDMDPIVNQHWDDIKNQNLANIPTVKDWASIRSPINYVQQLNENNTAVYLGKAYGDNLFQPNTLLDMFSQLTGPKHIDLVPGTHATAELLPSLVGIGDNLIWENTYKWFDIHLKGESNDLSNAKPLNMRIKFEGRYESFDDYPIAETRNTDLYFHPRSTFDTGDLETYSYDAWFGKDNTINAWAGTLFSTQIPLLSQLLEQFEIPILADVSAASDYRSIYFESDRLDSTMKIRGNPSIKVNVQPHYNKMQLVAYLYDMDWTGTGRLITHGVITLPQAPWGEKIELNFDMVTTAYDVPKGNRLVIAFDTKDPEYKSPTGADYFVDFEFSRNMESKLTVPHL